MKFEPARDPKSPISTNVPFATDVESSTPAGIGLGFIPCRLKPRDGCTNDTCQVNVRREVVRETKPKHRETYRCVVGLAEFGAIRRYRRVHHRMCRKPA